MRDLIKKKSSRRVASRGAHRLSRHTAGHEGARRSPPGPGDQRALRGRRRQRGRRPIGQAPTRGRRVFSWRAEVAAAARPRAAAAAAAAAHEASALGAAAARKSGGSGVGRRWRGWLPLRGLFASYFAATVDSAPQLRAAGWRRKRYSRAARPRHGAASSRGPRARRPGRTLADGARLTRSRSLVAPPRTSRAPPAAPARAGAATWAWAPHWAAVDPRRRGAHAACARRGRHGPAAGGRLPRRARDAAAAEHLGAAPARGHRARPRSASTRSTPGPQGINRGAAAAAAPPALGTAADKRPPRRRLCATFERPTHAAGAGSSAARLAAPATARLRVRESGRAPSTPVSAPGLGSFRPRFAFLNSKT